AGPVGSAAVESKEEFERAGQIAVVHELVGAAEHEIFVVDDLLDVIAMQAVFGSALDVGEDDGDVVQVFEFALKLFRSGGGASPFSLDRVVHFGERVGT